MRGVDFLRLCLVVVSCNQLGCSEYESDLLTRTPAPQDADAAFGGDGGARDGGGSADTGPNSDAAAMPDCRPNPDPLCPDICTETCNGKDDDCDNSIDE